ncbi:adenylyl-sulfate kinase [Sulfuriferula nivalis]|uniref:Sulfate adenylyltransferase n=1 Tax=Sulfuriferula nivalis TaxID=2675298 RepID=A0A809RJY4_9PROT|nr:adenylyl-sulfate kinase [Sulfuriferula nivalis]BBP01896.1 sulfate adenylyltransferase [Sulfuriferula nivalis]
MPDLISPYGAEKLTNLLATDDVYELQKLAPRLPSIALDAYQQSDLMLLISGAYTPLIGYMDELSYLSVLSHMRLPGGLTWMYPLTLAIPLRLAQTIQSGMSIALRDEYDELLAVLTVSEIFKANLALEAQMLGTDLDFSRESVWYVSGSVVGVKIINRYDFIGDYHTPLQLRQYFSEHGWCNVVAYQSVQPLHRATLDFMQRAAVQNQAGLLIQSLTGGEQHLHSTYFPTVRSYQALMHRLCKFTAVMSLSANYVRRGGVREILHRAIISRNYGCSHLIVGGEAAAQGVNRRGRDLLEGDAFHHVEQHIGDIGVKLIPYPRMVYVEDRAQYLPLEEAPKDAYKLVLTSEEVKRRLLANLTIPDWYTFPEVLKEMRLAYPPWQSAGFTILLTGVSGVGKSTLASALSQALGAIGARKVSLLDNDFINHHPGVADNVDVIAMLAHEIVKHHGIAICAIDVPTIALRRSIRNAVQNEGGYFEIALTAPTSVCAARLIKKNRSAQVAEVYEVPEQAELLIDTSMTNVIQAMQLVILKLEQEGYI